jgi:hypothetical protein
MANNQNLRPFKKGDPRINRKGRPKNFDKLRELSLQIAHEVAQKESEDLVISGRKVTIAEAILRQWATSKNPTLQKSFMEIAFGKVPDKVDLNVSTIDRVIEHELERVAGNGKVQTS